MPFAQNHYPFENKEKFEKNFPGDFVAEYIAQTRTWFYYMHAVSTILFNKAPFRNVVTTGTVLAEDGSKMSKSKNNFPDPKILFDKYGVDALRFYLLASPLMKSEDLNFSEKGVDEVYKKIILRLKNVVSFYETYRADGAGQTASRSAKSATISSVASNHVLDRWILERLNMVIAEVTTSMDSYTIDTALSKIDGFVEDVSVWYLRRSRERLKSENETEKNEALTTFRVVLIELSKVIAPFTPFLAEEIYRTVQGGDGQAKESVHLENWPENDIRPLEEVEVLSDMLETRRIVSLALEARAKAGIKVRQPLSKLVVKTTALQDKKEFLDLIIDEVNIKEVAFDPDLLDEVVLDTEITDGLREEGSLRELVRFIQDLRKKAGLKPGDLARLVSGGDNSAENFVEKFSAQIKKAALLSEISKIAGAGESEGDSIEIEGMKFYLKIEK